MAETSAASRLQAGRRDQVVYVLRREGTPAYVGKTIMGARFRRRVPGEHLRTGKVFDEPSTTEDRFGAILADNLTFHEARALETYLIKTYHDPVQGILSYNNPRHGLSYSETARGYTQAMRWAEDWSNQWFRWGG